ncbi:hypothetical protein K438DRAFT_1775136 [Mycena galopus ATCC 62051]|nr:hypothetical protein K438DRAFT_1775136 [Mycena galopus ATCC 62051]
MASFTLDHAMKAFLSFVKLVHPAVESEIDGHGLYSNNICRRLILPEMVPIAPTRSSQTRRRSCLLECYYKLIHYLEEAEISTQAYLVPDIEEIVTRSSGSTQVKQAMIQMNCLSLEALLAKKDNLATFNTMEIEDQECLGANLMEFGYFPIQKFEWKNEHTHYYTFRKHAYKQKEQMETMSTKQEDQYRKLQEDMDDMQQEQDRTLNKLLETEKQNEGLRNEADAYQTEIEAALKAEAETLRQQKKDLHKQHDHIERLQEELGALQEGNADTGNSESVATDMNSPMAMEKNAMAHFSSCDEDTRLKSVLLELKNSQMACLEAQKEAADYHQVLKAMETKTFELETQLSQCVEDLPTASSLEDQTTISDLRRELETQRHTIHIFYLNRNSEGTSVEIRGMNINESTSEIWRQLGRTLAQIAIANEQVLSFEQVLAPLVFVVIHGSSRISGFQARLKNVHKHIQRLDDTAHQQSSKTEGLQEQCDTLSRALSIEKEMAIQLQAKLAQATASNEKYVLRLEQTLAHLALVVICGTSRLSRLQARLTRIHKHIQRLDSIIDQLSTKHKGLQQQCNELEQAALAEQVAITQLKADYSTLSARCSASEAHAEELEQGISLEQNSSLNLQGEKEVLGEQNMKLQQKTEELQQKCDELEQVEQVSITQLRADYSTVSARCSALEQAISLEQNSSLNLQQENQELENQKIQFQQHMDELQQQCDELVQIVSSGEDTTAQLRTNHLAALAQYMDLQTQTTQFQQNLSRAEQEHESLQLNYENLQQEYENLQLEYEYLNSTTEEMQVNGESQLQQIIRTMEGEGDELHSQIESLKHENDMLHNNFERLQEHYTQKISESKNHTLMFIINQKAHILTQFQTNKELAEKKIEINVISFGYNFMIAQSQTWRATLCGHTICFGTTKWSVSRIQRTCTNGLYSLPPQSQTPVGLKAQSQTWRATLWSHNLFWDYKVVCQQDTEDLY